MPRPKTAALNGPFNTRIANRMRQLGMNKLEEFADHFGLGRTTVYALVQGRTSITGAQVKPSLDTLIKLAQALEIPAHVLLYELDPTAPGAETLSEHPPITKVPILAASPRIPVVGQVGAGPDQSDQLEESFLVEESFARGKNLIAFRVFGNSMEGGRNPIFDGDLVLVNTLDKGVTGGTVVARLEGDGHVCKRLILDPSGKPQYLTSTNPEYVDPTFAMIPADRVAEVVGSVVRVVRDIQSAS